MFPRTVFTGRYLQEWRKPANPALVISSVLYGDIGDWHSLDMIAVPRNTSGAWNYVILLVGSLRSTLVLYVILDTVLLVL